MDFRHEHKHEISFSDMLTIRARMRAVAQLDPHARDGCYKIRSLYFDTPTDRALREKLDGVNCREKFRIRYYNDDTSLIHLEKKSKQNGLCNKQSAEITADEAGRIAAGDIDFMYSHSHPLVRELYAKMRTQGLRARTIVDYTREPFIYAPGNVRVTLDYDIRTGLSSVDLLDTELPTVPVKGSPIILEVKWDEFLPSVIRDAVGLENRRVGAFSKYAACREYD